jgi:ABC-type transport system involved in cytochrome c biogenesis permease subunit
MATDAPIGQDTLTTQEADEQLAARRVRTVSSEAPLLSLLMPLASLKFTVVLFVLSIFLVFAGTLAQVDKDVWEVVKDYFRTPIAWIPFQIFFPQSFTGTPWNVPGGFYFPGGFTIGGLMGVNLLAAHALRFKVQAKGARLLAGLAVIALGVVLTWMVVLLGSGKETIQSDAPQQWSSLWTALKWTLVVLWGAGAYAAWQLDAVRKIERWSIVGFEVVLGALLVFIFTMGERAELGDSSLRILWQLIEGGVAGLVLLAGCILVFRKRAGIVLLHAGIALVMANELVVYFLHNENQMQITEGQTVDYAYDIRKVELAITDASNDKTDKMTVVPQWMLEERTDIRDEQLPFDIEIVKYLQNSSLQKFKAGEKNPADKGFGVDAVALPRRAGTGTDAGGKVDMSAAYVNVLKKGTKDSLGTYLVGIGVPEQKIDVDGKAYDLALRFQRHYKPYSVTLADVRAETYLGTSTPRNYSSDVRLVDKTRNVDTDVHIWMNNPLRYAGETFYQTSYDPGSGGREVTVLSIVSNTGWMIPYVACMLVGTGMLAQFSITLSRFLRRRFEQSGVAVRTAGRRKVVPVAASATARYFPFAITALAAIMVLAAARPRPIPTTEMKLDEFARLPVVHEGRVKPIDSVARNTLRYLSGKQSFKDENDKTQPAIKWFMDTIAKPPEEARKHKVLRIVSLELQELLGLPRRPGFRYSIDEFSGKIAELDRQVQEASKLEASQLTPYQKKLLELAKQLRAIQQFEIAFDPPQIRQDHAKEDLTAAVQQLDALSRMPLLLMVPPGGEQKEWDNFSSAWFNGLKDRVQGKEPNPAMTAMTKLIVAYGKGDVQGFNSELAQYQAWLAKEQPGEYNEAKVNYEEFFNTFEPFYWALVLYVVAFLLLIFSWLGWTVPLNRAAFWMIVLALVIHTFALASRIYISGRPPVTNLYSSAVFIGWAGVVFGLAFECIYRMGIGNLIAAVVGFMTLLIANFLAGLSDGDTLGVLQAVLDTQFWLATHVVCEVLGYSATFVAGLLGVMYIVRGVVTPSLTPTVSKDLSRMIYGTVCFAMFFSFVGTVLGGLWADDSWGRFWGWDPKENGALMIVIWNALVLHARWGGLVKERGLAALAVGGNIITGWSWFGVNELGVGLHSYGFTEGVLLALGIFIITQLIVIGMAMLPRNSWWSAKAGHAV